MENIIFEDTIMHNIISFNDLPPCSMEEIYLNEIE